MKNFMWFLCLCLLSISYAEDSKSVESINKRISHIDDSINAGNYSLFQCEDIEPTEGIPPTLRFYYREDRLIAIISVAGHESWSNEFRYYFNPNGNLMKYLKITSGQTDTPIRSGIIYNQDGSILWKNTDTPVIDGKKLENLFRTFQKFRVELSKY